MESTGARPKTTISTMQQAPAAAARGPRQLLSRLDFIDEDVALAYDNPTVAIGDELLGSVTGGEEWIDFYFQSATSAEILFDIQRDMNELYDSVEFPSITETIAYTVGSPCAARYAKDNRWYRARLKDISYNIVHFVDYGNQQMCNIKNVKPLTRSLAELIYPLAIHCQLASFQNLLLPSFVNDTESVKITIHSKHEPFEVSVQVVSQRSTVPGRPAPAPVADNISESTSSNSVNDSESGNVRHRTTPHGLTLPPPMRNSGSSSKFSAIDEEEDELERMKNLSKRARKNVTGGKLAITGYAGAIKTLYENCGEIALEGPYRSITLNFNCEQTLMNNGALSVDSFSRIFKVGDKFVCNARYEDSVQVQKNVSQLPPGYYQVTTMDPISNKNFLISHATVTFVSKDGATLFARNLGTNGLFIFAPPSTFPDPKKPGMAFVDCVQEGRTVIVRAVPADKYLDLQVNVDWVARSVEFLGEVVEYQGWMYFIRDEYSVLITDGGIGIGYVFVANKLVSDNGVKEEEWYGTRALFRACMDVPDFESYRSGVRWKGLHVSIMPEHSKGPYRYMGIWRPPPISFGGPSTGAAAAAGGGSGKKTDDDSNEGELELPEEAVREISVLGRDVIGQGRLNDVTNVKPILQPVTENLLNEREEIPPELLFTSQPAVEESSEVEITMIEPVIVATNNANNNIVSNDNNVSNVNNNATEPKTGTEVEIDLLGLNDSVELQTQTPSQPVSKPSDDLIGLWEGIQMNAGAGDQSENNSILLSILDVPLLPLSSLPTPPPDENGQEDPNARTREIGCQIEKKMQIAEERRLINAAPEFQTKLFTFVSTLSAEKQRKFYQFYLNTEDGNDG